MVIVEACGGHISTTLIDFCKGLTDKQSSDVLSFYLDADSFLAACHILSDIVDFAANQLLSDSFSRLVSEWLFISVWISDSGHSDVGQVAHGISILSLFAHGD